MPFNIYSASTMSRHAMSLPPPLLSLLHYDTPNVHRRETTPRKIEVPGNVRGKEINARGKGCSGLGGM